MTGSGEGSQATAIAVAVVEQAQCFLVGQRGDDVPLAGYWEFPGGKIEAGESPEEAAVRECLEETGILIEVVSAYPMRCQDYRHARVELHFFACRPVPPIDAPRNPFRWIPRQELRSLRFPKGNSEILQLLLSAAE